MVSRVFKNRPMNKIYGIKYMELRRDSTRGLKNLHNKEIKIFPHGILLV